MGGVQFWDMSVWTFIIELGVLFGAMLLANFLRRTIGPLRKSLIPSAVIGGFILLLANFLYQKITGYALFAKLDMELFTYHCLGLGFIALALKSNDRQNSNTNGKDIFNTGVTVVATYLIQAVVGLGITFGLSYLINNWANSGLLLPMGYGQGPGQAYNWGSIYQGYTEYPAFANGASFGLTVAAMGFVCASVGGVYHLNKMRRRGDKRAQVANAEEMEDLSAESVTRKGEIPLSESLDKLTVQFGLIFVTYFISFAAMYGVTLFLDKAGDFAVNTIKPLLWGFNFLVGTAFAMAGRAILRFFRKRGYMTRDYTNDFMLNRISGLMFDVMVVASIAAIDLSAFRYREFWLPLILVCVIGAALTFLYNRFMCHKLFPGYEDEAFLSLYGMLTGTASTGVILLREIDPLFDTPASHNLIYQNLWSIVLGAPMLLLLGFVARSMMWTWLCLGIFVVLLIVMVTIQLLGARRIGKEAGQE